MYGRLLLASGGEGCSAEALAVVAMVSTDAVFHLPRWVGEGAGWLAGWGCQRRTSQAGFAALPGLAVLRSCLPESLPRGTPLATPPATVHLLLYRPPAHAPLPPLQCRDKRDEAAEAHARFRSREGDHLTLLAVFRGYAAVSRKGHERAAWCRSHFVNPRAMRKALDIHAQVWQARGQRMMWARRLQAGGCRPPTPSCRNIPMLLQLKEHMQVLHIPLKSCGEDTLPVRRALVAGLFPHAAKRQLDGAYLCWCVGGGGGGGWGGGGGRHLVPLPASPLCVLEPHAWCGLARALLPRLAAL